MLDCQNFSVFEDVTKHMNEKEIKPSLRSLRRLCSYFHKQQNWESYNLCLVLLKKKYNITEALVVKAEDEVESINNPNNVHDPPSRKFFPAFVQYRFDLIKNQQIEDLKQQDNKSTDVEIGNSNDSNSMQKNT